jgi:hypothetical protein
VIGVHQPREREIPARPWRTGEDQRVVGQSVPEAGKRYFGLGAWGSYAAARRGDIPVIRLGRALRVPVRAMEQMLDRAGNNPPQAA